MKDKGRGMVLAQPRIEQYFREGCVLVRRGGRPDTGKPVGFDLAHRENNDPQGHRLWWEPRFAYAAQFNARPACEAKSGKINPRHRPVNAIARLMGAADRTGASSS